MSERGKVLEDAAEAISALSAAVRVLQKKLSEERAACEEFDAAGLASSVQYYYDDFKTLDASALSAEDAQRLYGVLSYVFQEMKKAGEALQ